MSDEAALWSDDAVGPARPDTERPDEAARIEQRHIAKRRHREPSGERERLDEAERHGTDVVHFGPKIAAITAAWRRHRPRRRRRP